MSEIRAGRRQRADAQRSRGAVLAAAIDLLARRPQATMDEIATAADVARQTVYAHYPSRDRLLAAVLDHVTADLVSTLDGVDLDGGSAVDALSRWVDAVWQVLDRYPILLTDALAVPPGDEYRQHLPISGRLIQVLERGRRAGELDDGPPVSWFVAATISLGHAAGQEVAAGRMPMQAAGEAFRRGVLSLCTRVGTPPPAGDQPDGPAAAAP